MKNKYCINCIWWYPQGTFVGQCRRKSPTRDLECKACWPLTAPNMGCGDWEVAEPVDVAKRKKAIVTKTKPVTELDLGEIIL